MPWYTYFLISFPEVVVFTYLTFTVFGIETKSRTWHILGFSALLSAITFYGAEHFGSSSLKVIIEIPITIVSSVLFFRFRIVTTILLMVSFVILIGLVETLVTFGYAGLRGVSFSVLVESVPDKIILFWLSAIVSSFIIFVFKRFNLYLTIPYVSEKRK
jgi:hypothetical protein